MNKVYLLMGGNLGDRQVHLSRAAADMEISLGKISVRSAIYQTDPWGKTDQEPFLNQCLLLETALDPGALMRGILQIEENLGRRRGEKYGPRIIDIDILFFNDATIDLPNLQIPHPQLAFRRFVLVPLCEIAAQYRHPLLHKTIQQLLQECPDPLNVKKI